MIFCCSPISIKNYGKPEMVYTFVKLIVSVVFASCILCVAVSEYCMWVYLHVSIETMVVCDICRVHMACTYCIAVCV